LNNRVILESLHIKQADITCEETDVIINAANPSLLGGGGVDGAIHRRAGSELLKECRALGGCDFGEARITKGYNLKAKYIIHTPGPIYKNGDNNESIILRNSYYNSLLLAKKYNLKSISFPSISTGVYNYPKEEACKIAVDTTIDFMKKENYIIEIFYVLFDDVNYKIYENFLNNQKML
jgi:O-acetyl-ADP-ribose deacetylase